MGRWVHPFEILLISPRVIKVVSCNFYRLVFIGTSLLKETKQSPIFYEKQPTLRFCHQIKIAKSFLFQWLTPVKILVDVDILYARPLHALYLSSSGPFLC